MKNTRLFAKLCELFSKDYIVLNADETGNHVLLLAKSDGAVCSYQFSADESKNNFIPENVKEASLSSVFAFEDKTEVSADVTDAFHSLSEQLKKLNSTLESTKLDLDEANNTITALRSAEDDRRKKAARGAVMTKLAAVNATRKESDRISEDSVKELLADCDSGKFNACANDKNEWTGEAEAILRLMARVGEEDLKLAAEREKNKKVHIWTTGGMKNCSGETESDIDALLQRNTSR